MTADRVDLSGARLVVGVSGSVAALGTPHLLTWLRARLGVTDVCVVLSEMAQRFVTRESLLAVADCTVVTGWSDLPPGARSHVGIAAGADVLLLMPATSNTVAKLAHGIADTVLTAVIAAATCPVIVAPSMSEATWNKPATRRNVAQLVADGYQVVEPKDGLSTSTSDVEFGSVGDFREPLLRALIKTRIAPARGEERP
ncbi:flavoprotein [Streptomyces sp. S.PNR 29]|uniref:flavoprotein n=1 Tax=Streptomyces sp. S.PNR 29 TaxID=2973805 RepID=UPI0025B17E7C|nr:flavoprotein [Streptomyces sp. S.PNR 29]MDN0195307.1 flavoprotein [Streptomyces sp. S.PNR 29]